MPPSRFACLRRAEQLPVCPFARAWRSRTPRRAAACLNFRPRVVEAEQRTAPSGRASLARLLRGI